MSVPWLGIQRIAVVPTFNTQIDGPPPPDWDYWVMSRVLYDPDPVTGIDRSLRGYLNALSYGQAILDVRQRSRRDVSTFDGREKTSDFASIELP